jgi:CDP-4-dehydro-6-deoxyglucose reductase, E3
MARVPLSAGRTFATREGESILDGALHESVGLPYSCRTGRCSTCKDIYTSRLIAPRTLPCKFHSIEKPASDVVRILLRFPPVTPLRYVAGQYVAIIGKGGTRPSCSIANAQRADHLIELRIRQVPDSEMSRYWFGDAKVNDLLASPARSAPSACKAFRSATRCFSPPERASRPSRRWWNP